MSVGVASRSNPYSTSTLFGRSGPFSSCRSLPSRPNTASAPSGAATFIVPNTRLDDGSVRFTQIAGSSGSFGKTSVARSGLTFGTSNRGSGLDPAEQAAAAMQAPTAHDFSIRT